MTCGVSAGSLEKSCFSLCVCVPRANLRALKAAHVDLPESGASFTVRGCSALSIKEYSASDRAKADNGCERCETDSESTQVGHPPCKSAEALHEEGRYREAKLVHFHALFSPVNARRKGG